jgi:predicted CXXCH cytochrome family protein
MECTACHREIHTYPHPPLSFQNRRELQISYYQACQICHQDTYSATLDSIHAEALAEGNLDAPICVDCHGAHGIQDPDQPRARVSITCGNCHAPVFEQYKNSIHGAALIQEDNPDVPVCTDCHGVHNIHDPNTNLFRIETPELCARCHSDPVLMGKYGISSDVYDIYSISWHGVDVSVYQARWPNLWHQSAVCTDCHGTNDMLPVEDPRSHVSEQNRLATCQQCHENAGPKFVSAWTGHYRISLEKTPFVYYTQAFYQSFAYTILWISAIYVLLQILRQTVQRVRNSLK